MIHNRWHLTQAMITLLKPTQPTPKIPHSPKCFDASGVYFVLGLVCLILGLIGIVVPGMPTTVLFFIGGLFWARSSRRFYAWLLAHRLFGQMIINWQTHRAIPRFCQILALVDDEPVNNHIIFLNYQARGRWVAWLLAAISLGVGIWMAGAQRLTACLVFKIDFLHSLVWWIKCVYLMD